MIGCLDNNHDHEDPRAPCVQATHTPGPSRSVTERQAVTAAPPLNSKTRLRVFQMPSYAPELNPQEGIWSLLKRSVANFVAADLTGLTRTVKRRLKKIQYRPQLIDGCLAETGLIMDTPQIE